MRQAEEARRQAEEEAAAARHALKECRGAHEATLVRLHEQRAAERAEAREAVAALDAKLAESTAFAGRLEGLLEERLARGSALEAELLAMRATLGEEREKAAVSAAAAAAQMQREAEGAALSARRASERRLQALVGSGGARAV